MNEMTDLSTFPPEVDLLRRRAVERKTSLFLVGGAVRDRFAGRQVVDYDFAVPDCGEELPWSVAREVGGRCFWLDRQRGQCRWVLKKGAGTITFDFAPLQGASIGDDLAARDFTINALALELTALDPTLIDPLLGLNDLREKVLRSCSPTSFPADPLRLLRAFRVATAFGLHMEPATRGAIETHAPLISRVAPERVRGELFKILDGPKVASTFRDMHSLGLLPCLFPRHADPQGALQAIDLTEQACADPIRWLPEKGHRLAAYLQTELEGGVTIGALLKFASFAIPAGESVAEMCSRFRLGRNAARCLKCLREGLDQQFLSLGNTLGLRSMYRLFKDLDAGPEMVVFSMAHHGVSGDLARRLASFYFDEFSELEELVRGRDIQKEFGVGEGEKVGALLNAVKTAERAGVVVTRDEALDFLRRKLLTKDHS